VALPEAPSSAILYTAGNRLSGSYIRTRSSLPSRRSELGDRPDVPPASRWKEGRWM